VFESRLEDTRITQNRFLITRNDFSLGWEDTADALECPWALLDLQG
jgi:hypothetical protein